MKKIIENVTLFLVRKMIVRNRKFRIKLLSLFYKYFREQYREDTPLGDFYFSCGEMIEASLIEAKKNNLKLNNTTIEMMKDGLEEELLMALKSDAFRVVE